MMYYIHAVLFNFNSTINMIIEIILTISHNQEFREYFNCFNITSFEF